MDWKQIEESIRKKSPEERVSRFRELDEWFDQNPAGKTDVTIAGPSGLPSTPNERADKINERMALAFQIARDA